ncbi:Rho GTPase activation protein [Irpex rosettiformis]|uniref:Rho GTPase activation protein n=1 Tax=Irpex rosettiformis TaxID=378272 RepID=A0ACB8UL87_9APHY|nr:Rho GTPase activation protein [Irpex rosettiformis]
MEGYMTTHGGPFLEASVGNVLRRICSERVAIETDPNRNRKTGKNLEKNVELLTHWCQELWKSIYDARKLCPDEMREIFIHIKALVTKQYGVTADHHADLPRQCISAFLFLRFFVPSILNPHLFGFWPGLTEEPVQRTLTQIAKIMQSLANLNVTVTEPDSMRAVRDFLVSSSPKMQEYLDAVSSKSSGAIEGSRSLSSAQRHDRKRLIHVVRHRGRSAPTLNREAIPALPQMIDLPKHLAVITSIVVRHTRRTLPTRTGAPGDRIFDDFCQKCLEVEEQALIRVSQLASHGKARRKLSSTADLTFLREPPDSPISPRSMQHRERKSSLQGEGRKLRRKSYRPSSAPGDTSPHPPASPIEPSPPPSSVGHATMSRAQSHELPRRGTELLIDDNSTIFKASDPRPINPSLAHHPRSTSTDSRDDHLVTASSSAPIVHLTADLLAAESEEEASRRKKGLLRGFRRK